MCSTGAGARRRRGLERAATRHSGRASRSGAVRYLRVRARNLAGDGSRATFRGLERRCRRRALGAQQARQPGLLERSFAGRAGAALGARSRRGDARWSRPAAAASRSRSAAASARRKKASRPRSSKSHRSMRSTHCPPRPSAARSCSSISAWSALATARVTARP